MNQNQRRIATAALLFVGVGGAVWAAASRTVYYHGSPMSSAVTVINGRPYVPLDDVAHALGGKVMHHGGDFEIATGDGSTGAGAPKTADGGANAITGTKGKIGDWFFNGYWRFRVSRVEHVDKYNFQFAAGPASDTPSGPNDELLVFYCTIKNGHKNSEEPILSVHGLGVQHTAVTDSEGQSYTPVDMDARGGSMVPGSAKNFAVIFSVPKSAKLNDLIFTAYGYGETSDKPMDVRVALGP